MLLFQIAMLQPLEGAVAFSSSLLLLYGERDIMYIKITSFRDERVGDFYLVCYVVWFVCIFFFPKQVLLGLSVC